MIKRGKGWLVETAPLKQIHEALSSFYLTDVRNLVTAGSLSLTSTWQKNVTCGLEIKFDLASRHKLKLPKKSKKSVFMLQERLINIFGLNENYLSI